MTKPKDKLYQIQYKDNTFRMIDLTKSEYDTIGKCMMNGKKYVKFDKAILQVDEIRAIVLMPEIQEPELDEEGKPVTPEYGGYDDETLKWLKDNGVDIVNGGMLE